MLRRGIIHSYHNCVPRMHNSVHIDVYLPLIHNVVHTWYTKMCMVRTCTKYVVMATHNCVFLIHKNVYPQKSVHYACMGHTYRLHLGKPAIHPRLPSFLVPIFKHHLISQASITVCPYAFISILPFTPSLLPTQYPNSSQDPASSPVSTHQLVEAEAGHKSDALLDRVCQKCNPHEIFG